MIEILRNTTEKTEVIKKPSEKCWINVVSPTDDEIRQIQSFVNVPEEVLTLLKDVDEIPTIEEYEDFTFIILRTPYNNSKIDLEYSTVPLGIFLKKDMVMTVCYFEDDIITRVKNLRFQFRNTLFVIKLMLSSAKLYLSYLKEIKQKMYDLESQLEQSQKNKVIMDFLILEKSLVYFSTSLKSNEILIERIAKDNMYMVKAAEERKLIQRVIDENKQGIEMSDIYTNILGNTLDAFASVISNNLNIVMKVLTSITIIVALPTLIASVYGMNIPLPFQNSSHAFLFVMILSFALSFGCALIFWKKQFL